MHTYAIAGQVLGAAFKHYPLMEYAFNGFGEQKKMIALQNLYTHCAKATVKYGGLILTEDKKGALIWLPSENFQLGMWRELISGMALIPFKIGFKATLRLTAHDAEAEGWIRKNSGSKMGYIWVVGVLASAQGKGYSRWLIDRAIADMKQQGLTEFWLKTEDPKNVQIYQKLGFEVLHEMVVRSSGLKSWVMRKG